MLVEALRSVCSQRLPPDEIIVVDDGSDDDTAAVVRAEFGARCRLVCTDNRGVAAARNLGVAQAHGDWIAFLDSDDLWQPAKLAVQMVFVEASPDTQICQTEEIWIRNAVRVNPRAYHRKPHGDVFLPSLERCLVSPSAVMMRRRLFERVGGFDESLPACEDYDLWLRISRTTPIARLDEALVIKRGGHADQLSRRHWGMDRFRVASLLRVLGSEPLSNVQRQALVRVVCEKCRILAAGAAKRQQHEEAACYQTLSAWARSCVTPSDGRQTGSHLAA